MTFSNLKSSQWGSAKPRAQFQRKGGSGFNLVHTNAFDSMRLISQILTMRYVNFLKVHDSAPAPCTEKIADEGLIRYPFFFPNSMKGSMAKFT